MFGPRKTLLEMILRSGCGVGATLSVTESPHRVPPSCRLADPSTPRRVDIPAVVRHLICDHIVTYHAMCGTGNRGFPCAGGPHQTCPSRSPVQPRWADAQRALPKLSRDDSLRGDEAPLSACGGRSGPHRTAGTDEAALSQS